LGRTRFENDRGISLLNEGNKLFVKKIAARLQRTAGAILLEELPSFRKGRFCSDNVHVIRQLRENYRSSTRSYVPY
jgi:hypothetical protein